MVAVDVITAYRVLHHRAVHLPAEIASPALPHHAVTFQLELVTTPTRRSHIGQIEVAEIVILPHHLLAVAGTRVRLSLMRGLAARLESKGIFRYEQMKEDDEVRVMERKMGRGLHYQVEAKVEEQELLITYEDRLYFSGSLCKNVHKDHK